MGEGFGESVTLKAYRTRARVSSERTHPQVRERAYARAIVSAHARVNGERSLSGQGTLTGTWDMLAEPTMCHAPARRRHFLEFHVG